MIYQLDTNTCVEFLRHGSTSNVAAHLAAVPEDDIGISTVVLGELLFGALHSKDPVLATSSGVQPDRASRRHCHRRSAEGSSDRHPNPKGTGQRCKNNLRSCLAVIHL